MLEEDMLCGSRLPLLCLLVTACGAPPDVMLSEADRNADGSEVVGTLVAPLRHYVGTSEFRLEDVAFTLRGPVETTVTPPLGAEALVMELPPGSYDVSLSATSSVKLDTPAGRFPIEALLVSANPKTIEIAGGSAAALDWWFSVTSHVLAFGEGERAPSEPVNGVRPCPRAACADRSGDDFDECIAKCEFSGDAPTCHDNSDCSGGTTCCLQHPKQGAPWRECRAECPALFAGETLRVQVCTDDADCAVDRRCVRAATELVRGGGLCL